MNSDSRGRFLLRYPHFPSSLLNGKPKCHQDRITAVGLLFPHRGILRTCCLSVYMLSVTIYFRGATLVPKDPHIFASDDTSRTQAEEE